MSTSLGPRVASCCSVLRRKKKVGELCGDIQRAVDLVALEQAAAHIDDDEHIRAHAARDAHRHVVGQPPVHEQATIDLDRVERGRHGQTGAN